MDKLIKSLQKCTTDRDKIQPTAGVMLSIENWKRKKKKKQKRLDPNCDNKITEK